MVRWAQGEEMALFDKMFGSDASVAEAQPETQQRFEDLKAKYANVLRAIDAVQIRLRNLHVQENKLFLKGAAPSEEAKRQVWDAIRRADPTFSDITADITVEPTRAEGGRIHKVRPGETLPDLSRQYYGTPNEYMRIFYANRETLSDPESVEPGQELTIPPM
ncbi:MAG: LysM peptidoglycan-binding domain-containing protein [Bryobacteraceae bacterium]